MRVLICPTAFKGTLTAAEAASALAAGVREALPGAELVRRPVSDGGPGLLEALLAAGEGDLRRVQVQGPHGQRVRARALWTAPAEAVLESADACGLHLVPEPPRPLEAHTIGVGELVKAAVERGAEHVFLGLGGSATTDGGTGMARAFGWRFLDRAGRELPPGGGPLQRLARIEPGRPPATRVVALADVDNPLSGARGAARTYGPQKGASPAELERLVEGLERFDQCLRRDLGRRVGDLPGSGAAGGLGAGCAAFLDAGVVGGAGWVLERTGFDAALEAADLLVTGEGAFDATTRRGKIVDAVLRRAAAAGVPALLVCGRIEGEPPAPSEAAVALDGGGRRLDGVGLSELAAEAVRRFR